MFHRIALPILLILACGATPSTAVEPVDEPMHYGTSPSFSRPQGVVRPHQEAELAVDVDGVVREILVAEGQGVAAGELLVKLNDAVAAASVRYAETVAENQAEERRAEARLRFAERSLLRVEKLNKTGNVVTEDEVEQSRSTRDQSQAEYDAAKAALAEAKALLQLEQARLKRYHVSAPFAGRVVRILVESGDGVAADEPLLHLAAFDKLEVEINVPLHYYEKLAADTSYRMLAGEPLSRDLSGRLKYVDPVFDYAAGAIRCVFEIDNAEQRLPAGFAVQLILDEPVDGDEVEETTSTTAKRVERRRFTHHKLARPAAARRWDRLLLE